MEENLRLGVDIGSVSTKAVVIGANGETRAAEYLWTEGDPVGAVRRVLRSLRGQLDANVKISAVGTTGSARKLVGLMLKANAVKNEITAHAVGTLLRRPDVRTILEIGGQDSKLILLRDGVVADYAMNSLCAAGTGAFLSSQAARLGILLEDLGKIALASCNPAKIAARCTVFAESDMVHKAQAGYGKDDLAAGLCNAVADNYLNNVGKGKRIEGPVVFLGGVSRNPGVVAAFERLLGQSVSVEKDGHLMGAIGAAVLAGKAPPLARPFDFSLVEMDYKTTSTECGRCANHCEIITFYRGNSPVDRWGARCTQP